MLEVADVVVVSRRQLASIGPVQSGEPECLTASRRAGLEHDQRAVGRVARADGEAGVVREPGRWRRTIRRRHVQPLRQIGAIGAVGQQQMPVVARPGRQRCSPDIGAIVTWWLPSASATMTLACPMDVAAVYALNANLVPSWDQTGSPRTRSLSIGAGTSSHCRWR